MIFGYFIGGGGQDLQMGGGAPAGYAVPLPVINGIIMIMEPKHITKSNWPPYQIPSNFQNSDWVIILLIWLEAEFYYA